MHQALPTQAALSALRNAYRSDLKLKAALNLAAKNLTAGKAYRLPAKSGPYRDAQRHAVKALARALTAKPTRRPERTVYQVKVGSRFVDVRRDQYRDQNTGVDRERPGTRMLKQYAADITSAEAAGLYQAETLRVQAARAVAPSFEDARFVRDTSADTPVAQQPHFYDVDEELLKAEAAATADRLVWQAAPATITENFVHQPVRPDYSRELADLAARQALAKPLLTPTAKRIIFSSHGKQLEQDQLECEAFFVADELSDALNEGHGVPAVADLEADMLSPAEALARAGL